MKQTLFGSLESHSDETQVTDGFDAYYLACEAVENLASETKTIEVEHAEVERGFEAIDALENLENTIADMRVDNTQTDSNIGSLINLSLENIAINLGMPQELYALTSIESYDDKSNAALALEESENSVGKTASKALNAIRMAIKKVIRMIKGMVAKFRMGGKKLEDAAVVLKKRATKAKGKSSKGKLKGARWTEGLSGNKPEALLAGVSAAMELSSTKSDSEAKVAGKAIGGPIAPVGTSEGKADEFDGDDITAKKILTCWGGKEIHLGFADKLNENTKTVFGYKVIDSDGKIEGGSDDETDPLTPDNVEALATTIVGMKTSKWDTNIAKWNKNADVIDGYLGKLTSDAKKSNSGDKEGKAQELRSIRLSMKGHLAMITFFSTVLPMEGAKTIRGVMSFCEASLGSYSKKGKDSDDTSAPAETAGETGAGKSTKVKTEGEASKKDSQSDA